MIRYTTLALLYFCASPVYAILGFREAVKLWRTRTVLREGAIACVHCGAANQLDVLARCGKCKTAEYGNRLRCSACGDTAKAFDCDACGVTIRVL
ncbi:MAG TPA: hypothetical protein VNM92_05635 [Thermoanaerobaculia bacterium]|nr:hypothetical protein [Thermoanaerobaculia bacterium]